MSNFHSDLKNTSFVKSPANAVVDFYEQYVHDMADETRISQTTIVNLSLIIVKSLENYGIC